MTVIAAALHHTVSTGTRPFATLIALCRRTVNELTNPYHPERHYMRGPGPAWCKKHGVADPLRAGRT